jgi:hypothetical protein
LERNLKTEISHGLTQINTDKTLRYAKLALYPNGAERVDVTRCSSVKIRVHPWLKCFSQDECSDNSLRDAAYAGANTGRCVCPGNRQVSRQ